jgi:hypothetical protein
MAVLVMLLVAGAVVLMVGLKLLVGLVILPFKILGFVIKGIGGLVGLLFGLVGLVAAVLVLPLLPLVVLGGIVWLIVRAARPRPAPAEIRVLRG